MLTLKQLRDNREDAIRRLKKKGVDAEEIIARIEELDNNRKALQNDLDNLLAQQNQAAKQIGALMAKGLKEEAEAAKQTVAQIKVQSQQLAKESEVVAEALQAEIVKLPNLPADIVPEGRTAEDNVVVKLVERESKISSEALPHWELAKKYDIIDFDLGVKLTGAGFPVYKKALDSIPEGNKVAMFLKINYLSGKQRYKEIYSKTPPQRVYVFSSRVSCSKNNTPEGFKHGAMDFVWMVWEKGQYSPTELRWLYF